MDSLPVELLTDILKRLPICDRICLRRTCRRWYTSMPFESTLEVGRLIPKWRVSRYERMRYASVALSRVLQCCGQRLKSILFTGSLLPVTKWVIDCIFEHCPNIVEVNLSCCVVHGDAINRLARFRHRLKVLNLCNASFTISNCAQFQQDMVELLLTLTNLQTLNLSRTTAYALSALQFVSLKLTSLNLNDCKALRPNLLCQVLSRCHALRELRLSGFAAIDDLTLNLICTLTHLQTFELSHLTCAELFYCHRSFLADNCRMNALKNLQHLRAIYFQYNRWITNAVVRSISEHCANLNVVNMSCCSRVTNFDPLCSISSLSELTVGASDCFSDAQVITLAKATNANLRLLHCSCCPVGSDGILALAHHCPNLIEVCFDQCERLNSTSLSHLFNRCRRLRHVSLIGTFIDDQLLPFVEKLHYLQYLNISYCSHLTLTGIVRMAERLEKQRSKSYLVLLLIIHHTCFRLRHTCLQQMRTIQVHI